LVDFYHLKVVFSDFDYLNHVQIILVFSNNEVKYHIINCISTFQKEKQNWEQICKRKRFRKRLLSAGSGSAQNSTASASLIVFLSQMVVARRSCMVSRYFEGHYAFIISVSESILILIYRSQVSKENS
jgi:benzoyl-CoA reductase/2-hydroxyglutaryl-CoA dehydratase subunit BcrC/BadD/HgdB